MIILPFGRDARLRARLRQLQRHYYTASGKDEAIIREYIATLSEARAFALRGTAVTGIRALHAGAGGHNIAGWINADSQLDPAADLLADFSTSIPFRDDSLDYIHSEDFLEHLPLASGKSFLMEAYRVLKAGGVMRLITPDLRALVQTVYFERSDVHLRWCEAQLGARGPAESLNMHLRMNGEHHFIYDEEMLRAFLVEVGFGVRSVSWNRSPHAFLRFLDLRDFGLSLYLEATKPDRLARNGRA